MTAQVATLTRPQVGPAGLVELTGLAESFPLRPHRLRHALVDHPLLTRAALAEAAMRMDPTLVECRRADNRNGEEFAFADRLDGGAAAVIREIETAGRWVMLRFAEQLPEYAALMREVLDALDPVTRPVLGEVLTPHVFIFVSGPGTLTPFHFDPEFNVLFQVAGEKVFAAYEPRAPWLSPQASEKYHATGDNMLEWREEFAEQGQHERLLPGDALFVPYRSPHWVTVGDEASISISITWRSASSYAQDDAFRLNRWLRGFGLSPPTPPAQPASPRLRALAWHALKRLGVNG
ncbi:cupin-like domain-containing protein [Tsuneonella mangrovi]|uniref:cupin-like domain-containing protein n=1 Tax=Tsuneonella mangrovi TaxID=1982042 RepID=UPI0014712069|nr:cupin-like domain-containing protein [Tsuneonella mangrovi]